MTKKANTNIVDSRLLNADICNTDTHAKIMEKAVNMLWPVSSLKGDRLQCQPSFQ